MRKALPDYSPLALKVGKKMRAVREATGYSIRATAEAIGVRSSYYKAIEEGRFFPSQELQRRFVRWAFKKHDWRLHPTIPAKAFKRKLHKVVGLNIYDKAFYRQWEQTAKEVGCSMMAFAEEAIRRLMADEPTIVSIKQAIKTAERMREQQILDANPDLFSILDADPVIAKLVHKTEEVQVLPARPPDDEKLLHNYDSKRYDGPAVPVELSPWVKGRKS